MALSLLAIAVLVLLTAGYLLYGSYIARQFRIDARAATPASTINDGVDFIPTRPFYLLAQHFSAIAAAGPIVGPVLACMSFGWLPCLIWICVGVVFIGAMHDFAALIASVRHGAHSIADVAKQHLGTRAYLALTAFIWLALVYVVVAFTNVTAAGFIGVSEDVESLHGRATFNVGGAVAAASIFYLLLALVMGVVQRVFKPPMWLVTLIFVPATLGVIYLGTTVSHLSIFAAPETLLGFQQDTSTRLKVYFTLILIYCLVASMLPLWLLQQPRGYLGGFVLYLAIAIGLLGILFGGFEIKQPAIKPVADYAAFFGLAPADAKAPPLTALIFPFLFVTIACGACSGFHGLVCGGTTSKQLAKETHCQPIAFGAMLMEGFVAVIALATVMILASSDLPKYQGRPSAVYGDGLASFISAVFGITSERGVRVAQVFGTMAVATFVFDTLDVSTRLGRYLLQELFSARSRLAAFLGAAASALVPLIILLVSDNNAYLLFWTLFGTSNQLLASLTLLGITVWLYRSGRSVRFVFIPTILVMGVTVTALSIQIFVGVRDMLGARWTLPTSGALNPTVLNALVAIALLSLAIFFVVQAARAVRGRSGSSSA